MYLAYTEKWPEDPAVHAFVPGPGNIVGAPCVPHSPAAAISHAGSTELGAAAGHAHERDLDLVVGVVPEYETTYVHAGHGLK